MVFSVQLITHLGAMHMGRGSRQRKAAWVGARGVLGGVLGVGARGDGARGLGCAGGGGAKYSVGAY